MRVSEVALHRLKQLPKLEVLGIDLVGMPDSRARGAELLEFKRLKTVHIGGPYKASNPVQAITATGTTILTGDRRIALAQLRSEHRRVIVVDGSWLRSYPWPDEFEDPDSVDKWSAPRYGL